VGLGVVDGGNRVRAAAEIRSVEHALPATAELWLGGRDAREVSTQLGSSRALVLAGPGDAGREAERLRDTSVGR
jgi:hypothetical protein